MTFKKTYAKLNELLPFDLDISVQQALWDKMVLMSFLAGLSYEFETVKSQVLTDTKIVSSDNAFRRLISTKLLVIAHFEQHSSVLLSRAPTYLPEKQVYKNGGSKSSFGRGKLNKNA